MRGLLKLRWNKAFIFLLVLACARVGYPPGKPEINSPKLEINYKDKFNKFPIEINIKITDDTKVESLIVFVNEQKIYEFQFPDSLINLKIDTIKNFSDTIAIYNFKFKAMDIYENSTTKQIQIYYKKEENKPIIEIIDTTGITFRIYDDTRLKNLYIFKNDSLLKQFNLTSKDTTISIKPDSLFKSLRIKVEDIYLNFEEKTIIFKNGNK